MKGLRFNLRTLFLVTAILAGAIYFGWRYSKYHPPGHIPDGLFAFQVEDDGQGLLFTITASTKPIENVVFELRKLTNAKPIGDLIYATGLIHVYPCDRKQLRVIRNFRNEPSIENTGLRPTIRLPLLLEGSNYALQLRHNQSYQHLGGASEGSGVLSLYDEQGREYVVWLLVNQRNSLKILPNP